MCNESPDVSAFAEKIFTVNLTPERIALFWSKVSKSEEGCWEWTGPKLPRGYGTWSLKKKRRKVTLYAHRVSFYLSRGYLPAKALICHKCDNPSCARPDHLFAGTHDDNMADMVRKGRSLAGDRHNMRRHPKLNPRGVDRAHVKLTEDAVREIRWFCEQGCSQQNVGKLYGVAQSTVGRIVRRQKWKHVL
jgi:predicted DNA-binding protein (UPF0251 family)